MTVRFRSVLTGAVLSLALVSGCSSGGSGNDAARLETIPAAQPATSPPQTAAPAGTVTSVGVAVNATVVDESTRTLVLAATGPDRLLLLDLDNLSAPARTTALPGTAARVQLAGSGGSVLVALPKAVARVNTSTGALTSTAVDGDVTAVLQLPDGRIAAGLSSGSTLVLGSDGAVQATIGGLAGVDELVLAGTTVLAVDRQQTAAAVIDVGKGTLGSALRAGEGATNAVTDQYGRALLADTTGDELLALSSSPLLLRQRYPVAGAPYGIAYDAATNIVWMTLTAANQVVGLDVKGGEPQERYRFDTVTQPNSVAVDSATGVVLVGSANGAGLQRLAPGAAR